MTAPMKCTVVGAKGLTPPSPLAPTQKKSRLQHADRQGRECLQPPRATSPGCPLSAPDELLLRYWVKTSIWLPALSLGVSRDNSITSQMASWEMRRPGRSPWVMTTAPVMMDWHQTANVIKTNTPYCFHSFTSLVFGENKKDRLIK